jgi:chemotaxis protein methyltransferase WspC
VTNLDAVERLARRIGLAPESLGPSAAAAAVAARMRALGLTDQFAYGAALAVDADEQQLLAEELAVPETWFFRGGAVFAYLAARFRDEWPARHGRPFRVLSVPCSSGEEPYSIALALEEAAAPDDCCTILGVDLSRRQLAAARRAVYSENSFRQIDVDLRSRYFTGRDGKWSLVDSVKRHVGFAQANLADPEFLSDQEPFDLIFCRNLLIYFDEPGRRQARANLERLLAPAGRICLGPAEPLDPADHRYRPEGPAEYFLYRRVVAPQPHPWRPTPLAPLAPRPSPAVAAPTPAPAPLDRLLEQARRAADDGRLPEAAAACEEALRRFGANPDAYCLLGLVHQSRRERNLAAECFTKALYLLPEHAESLLHLMLLRRDQGDVAAAALLERRLRRVRPEESP